MHASQVTKVAKGFDIGCVFTIIIRLSNRFIVVVKLYLECLFTIVLQPVLFSLLWSDFCLHKTVFFSILVASLFSLFRTLTCYSPFLLFTFANIRDAYSLCSTPTFLYLAESGLYKFYLRLFPWRPREGYLRSSTIARNGLPRMMGTDSSTAILTTMKSTGAKNLPI